MANCNNKNPLQHNGSARAQRLLPGLQQGYANVDEKTFADWIVFAKNFSHYLNYYDAGGAQTGNWSVFFSNDLCALMGDIAVQDVDAYKRNIKNRFDFLKDDDNKAKTGELKTNLNNLFSAVTSFALSLDGYYRLLPAGTALKVLIENIVPVTLSKPFEKLLKYYKAAADLGFLPNPPVTTDNGWKVLGSFVTDASLLKTTGLTEIWWKHSGAASWDAYYLATETGKDESIFGDPVPTDYQRINHAANHNLFAAIFQQFLMSYSRLVSSAEKELLASLEKQNDHAPHYALFLAFLKLFRLAQDGINSITQRHLDFYYKEVLQLKQKPALPNSAHIIAELAKPVDDFVLTKNALLKAGKDSGGKEVLYATNNETVFNKAVVTSLRSVYFGTEEDNYTAGTPPENITNKGRLFAAPVINSADGIGAELITANKEWQPFANRLIGDGKVTAVAMPKAEIGFAVASHYLYLQEGKRQVSLKVVTSLKNELVGKKYAMYLTTEKGWYKVVNNINISYGQITTANDCINFSFSLKGNEPAVSNYDPKKHGGTLAVSVPVLKIILLNNDKDLYEFGEVTQNNELRNITITQLKIEVKVGMDTTDNAGLKQLQVTTDAGVVDVSKPFLPFGPLPVTDKNFIIGSKELFCKKNASVTLNIQWAGITDFTSTTIAYPPDTDFPDTRFDFLQEGRWGNASMDFAIFNTANPATVLSSVTTGIPVSSVINFDEVYKQYGAESNSGFMRLVLNKSFGHLAHQLQLSKHLIGLSKTPPKTDEGFESPGDAPYTPLIQSLTLSYSADTGVINLSYPLNDISSGAAAAAYKNKQACFFHLYPFGDAEQHSSLNKETTQYLFPQFRHKAETGIVEHQAEFYIGLQYLQAGQSVNILFQVMDGTANPVVTKPEDHIHWSYLSNNQWKGFDKNKVNDGTLQLVQSGIIQFIIPADATTANTIMSAGYIWLRASVKELPDAVCKLISVNAQAALALFKDNNTAADFLNTALPAQTISKLKAPLAAIKKITQPYSSFGGRPAETGTAFYTRVSERLRHKSRAVTIWDYEHLILEAFPLIHKVKCLNHTKSDSSDYNEVAPGHVTIITIPDLKQRNDADLLRPYTSQATIEAIKIFLRKKISCHVQLHVENPDFEQVRMKLKVKLAANYNDFTVYSKKLQEDITAFLSPWAYGASDIGFGGKIYKSALINFIEERPYVDFITNVEMAHLTSTSQLIQADNDDITATTAKGILVSVPASKHIICNYDNNQCTQP